MSYVDRVQADIEAQRQAIQSQTKRGEHGGHAVGDLAGVRPPNQLYRDTTQADLAAQREAIRKDLQSRTGGVKFDQAKDLNFDDSGYEATRGKADTRRAGVVYEPDAVSKASPHAGDTDFRVAKVVCPRCAGTMSVHQSKSQNGDGWTPNESKVLEMAGWATDSSHWFCGQYCRTIYKEQVGRDAALVPVVNLGQPSAAREIYKTKTDTTTPAAAAIPTKHRR